MNIIVEVPPTRFKREQGSVINSIETLIHIYKIRGRRGEDGGKGLPSAKNKCANNNQEE